MTTPVTTAAQMIPKPWHEDVDAAVDLLDTTGPTGAPRLIIARGLPASGKSTIAARWAARDPQRRAVVTQDDIRTMLHRSTHVPRDAADPDANPGTERAVRAVRDASIRALLNLGVEVFNADTNLKQRSAVELRRLADLAKAGFQILDLTGVGLDICLARNARRTGTAHVPAEVITDMWTRFVKPLNGQNMPIPVPATTGTDDAEPYVPVPGTPTAVMVDIDGTTAIMCARSPYDETRVHEDTPNPGVIAAIRAMHAAGHRIIYCSGRTNAARAGTEAWLAEHVGVPYEALHMRAVGDCRNDAVVKLEIFNQAIRPDYTVIAVFDDRNRVVDAWRGIGLTVFQVAPGDF